MKSKSIALAGEARSESSLPTLIPGFPTMAMAREGGKKKCTRTLRLHAICYGSFVASTVDRGAGTVVRGEPQIALLCGIVHTHSFTP